MSSATVRNSLIAIGGGALVLLSVAWFLATHERVEREVPVPPSGEAAYNPLYALQQTLRGEGIEVQSRQRLDLEAMQLAPGDTLLLYNDPGVLHPREARALLAWVERGGHLLLRTPPSRAGSGDAPLPPVLRALGLDAVLLPSECQTMLVAGQEQHVEFCNGQRFEIHALDPSLAWGDETSGYVFARLPRGEGVVDLLADFDFLANDALDEAPHQALTRQLLAPNYRDGTVHLVYAARLASFWRMLAERFWPVWVTLVLLLAAWLWRRMQRFGPLLPGPQAERRSLLEHVRASGGLLYRYRQAPLLYRAVRTSFLARLRRRLPVAAALEGDLRAAAVAERLQLPIDHVRTALEEPAAGDRHAFLARVRTLIQMRNRL